jgi:hypothetical protein
MSCGLLDIGSLLTWETPPPRFYAEGRCSQGPLQLKTQRLVALKREKFVSQQTTDIPMCKFLALPATALPLVLVRYTVPM